MTAAAFNSTAVSVVSMAVVVMAARFFLGGVSDLLLGAVGLIIVFLSFWLHFGLFFRVFLRLFVRFEIFRVFLVLLLLLLLLLLILIVGNVVYFVVVIQQQVGFFNSFVVD